MSHYSFCSFRVWTDYCVTIIHPSQMKIIYAQSENIFTSNNKRQSHQKAQRTKYIFVHGQPNIHSKQVNHYLFWIFLLKLRTRNLLCSDIFRWKRQFKMITPGKKEVKFLEGSNTFLLNLLRANSTKCC